MNSIPDRIETQVTQELRIQPTGVTLALHVTGSAAVGSMAAVRKSKELLAIQEAMRALDVAEDRIRIESVAFAAGERWLSGSSVDIDVEIRDIPVRTAPEALGALSAIKGVSLTDVRREYGDLTAQRDELLRRAVSESMRQARLIADTAGLRLRTIYSMSQRWADPSSEKPEPHEMARGGQFPLASAAPDSVKGYQLMEHHDARLGVFVRMEWRVGEFGENG